MDHTSRTVYVFLFLLPMAKVDALSSGTQVIVSTTHSTYEHTDYNISPYYTFAVNETSECALRCATSSQCQVFVVYSNVSCRLYDQSQCIKELHSGVLLRNVQGAQLYEKRIVSNGGKTVDTPMCLMECLRRSNGLCKMCGRSNHGGKFCEQECPKDWIMHQTKLDCYIQVGRIQSDYFQLEGTCQQLGSTLVVDDEEEIHTFLKKLIRPSRKNSLIGLTDLKVESDWVHSNGDRTNFSAWAPGEPLGIDTDCVAYGPPYGYKMSVGFEDCNTVAQSFCTYPKGSSSCTNQSLPCTVWNSTQKTFNQATKDCVGSKGTLLSILNAYAWNWVANSYSELIFLGHKKPVGSKNDIDQIQNCPNGQLVGESTFLKSTPDIWFDIYQDDTIRGDCVVLKRRPASYRWRDIACNTEASYICEYQLKGPEDDCPTTEYTRRQDKYCLKLSSNSLEYKDAEKDCEQDRARLVVINDQEMHDRIMWTIFSTAEKDKSRSYYDQYYYIGLTDREQEGSFVWADSTTWEQNKDFDKFFTGFPTGYNLDCAILDANGFWVSASCTEPVNPAYENAICRQNSKPRLSKFNS